MSHYIIHTDGGARGNPGPAAIGVVIEGPDIEKKEYGQYIGETTNNIAEYRAVAFALHKLKHLIGSEKASKSSAVVHTDSELLARQIGGKYKVKDPGIQELFFEIWNLKPDFAEIQFLHVLRDANAGADKLVNWALDREENRLV